jgi:hypothetical protein
MQRSSILSTENHQDETREDKPFRTWFRRGQRVKQGYDWYGRFKWLASLFKTKAEVAMAVGSASVIGTVATLTTIDAVETRRIAAEPLPAVVAKTERTTRTATVFTVEGFDKTGRRGLFDVVVAKKQFLWVKGSSDEIEKDGRILGGSAIASEIFDTEVTAALAAAREIVAVGTASQEGIASEEKARAGKRALKAAEIAANAVGPDIPISALNLGQYREPCTECETEGTHWQRPFMVVAAKELDPDVDLGEALEDAMSNSPKLPSPSRYSTFELAKIR